MLRPLPVILLFHMKEVASFGQACRPFVVLCLLVLALAAGCGDDSKEDTEAAGSEEFGAPVLKSPAFGAVIDSGNPVVEWFAVPSAVAFQVEISVNDDFNELEFVQDVPVTSFMITDFPLEEGTHFWRVRARSSTGVWSPWSMVSSFVVKIDSSAKGDGAHIVRPSGNTTVFVKGEVVFLAAVPDARDTYRCTWDFGELGSYNGEPSSPVPVRFDTPGTYTARFIARGGAGMEFTDEVEVSVVDECPDLLEPEDGFSTSGDAVDFSWSPVDGASSYILFIPSNGTSAERSVQVLETTTTETGFEPGTYLWWVYAVDSQGNLSSCPEPRVFSVREIEAEEEEDDSVFIRAVASLLRTARDPEPVEAARVAGLTARRR